MSTHYFKDGLKLDSKGTFGKCKYVGLNKTTYLQNEAGELTADVKQRVYNLKSYGQGQIIQVILSGEVSEKKFNEGEEILIVEPTHGAVASGFGREAGVNEFIRAKDIVKASALVKNDKKEN